jgi:hypothetical protein
MRKLLGIFVLEGHRVFMFMNLQVTTCLVQSDVILWGPKILPVPVVPANDVSSPFTRTFLSSKLVLSLLWHPERKQDNRNENMNPILRDLSSLSYHEIHLRPRSFLPEWGPERLVPLGIYFHPDWNQPTKSCCSFRSGPGMKQPRNCPFPAPKARNIDHTTWPRELIRSGRRLVVSTRRPQP